MNRFVSVICLVCIEAYPMRDLKVGLCVCGHFVLNAFVEVVLNVEASGTPQRQIVKIFKFDPHSLLLFIQILLGKTSHLFWC